MEPDPRAMGLPADRAGALSSLHLGMGWFPDDAGGLNRYLRELTEELSLSAPVRAVVVGPASEPPEHVDVVSLVEAPLLRRLRLYEAAAARMRETAVVDVHFALYAFAPVLLGRLRRQPLVVHFHGPWADESLADGSSRAASLVKRVIERRLYSRAREVVVLSRAFGRLLVERYGVSPWRITVVPPGVQLERFSPGGRSEARQGLGLSDETRVVLAVRRLVPRMGLEVVIDAWSRIEPSKDLLVIVGDGPIRPALETRVEELGLGSRVRLVGRVEDQQLVDWYRAAEMVVVPSLALEGFGLVVLEALACGTPVIATDVGGLPETLGQLDQSMVVPAGDVEGLANRVASALDGTRPLPGPTLCREHAERHTWAAAANRHFGVYARAVRPHQDGRLRVVYVDHTAALSGGELALLRLLPALKSIKPHVILGEEGPLVQRLQEAGVSVEVLAMTPSLRALPRNRVALGVAPLRELVEAVGYSMRLARRLRSLNPDLVHTNSLKSALYGGVAGRLVRVPVVWHVRDRIAADYLGRDAARLVRAAAGRLPDAIIANSATTLGTLGSHTRGHVIGSPVIVNGVNDARRRRIGLPLAVGMVGRISPWKGQHVFVRAFGQAFPAGSERAVIVGAPMFGEDDRAYGAQVHDLARGLGLDGRITFVGFTDDVDEVLRSLDVLVHASVLPEPFGQVVIEGMAAGLPVIAAAAGGPAEVIEHGETGLLYPPGDVGALAAMLRRLAADPTLRNRLGTAAREAVRHFEADALAPKIVDVYRQVLDDRNRSRGARIP
jgi:glycosyltransferase involved in cell wall biosynthesis